VACVVGTVAGCLATAHILQAQRHRPLPACCDHSAAGRDGQGGRVLACALLKEGVIEGLQVAGVPGA
jgi:hypothetical protein